MNKARFRVIKDFHYENKSYIKGTVLNEIHSKVNILGLHYNIESIGWINAENPITTNLEKILI